MKAILFAVILAGAATASCGVAAAQTPVACARPAAVGELKGPVLRVLDGQTLCVATGPEPDQWVQVRLDDAPEAALAETLMSVAFGQDAHCRIRAAGTATNPAAGVCDVGEQSIGSQLLTPAAIKAGYAWTRERPLASPPTRVAAAP